LIIYEDKYCLRTLFIDIPKIDSTAKLIRKSAHWQYEGNLRLLKRDFMDQNYMNYGVDLKISSLCLFKTFFNTFSRRINKLFNKAMNSFKFRIIFLIFKINKKMNFILIQFYYNHYIILVIFSVLKSSYFEADKAVIEKRSPLLFHE
jgi:hypothetical protein